MIIPAGRRRGPPSVSLRAPNTANGQQLFAFNSSLCAEFLQKTRYVALAFDSKKEKTYFIPCGAMYKNQPTYKLVRDGGNNHSGGKAIYLAGEARQHFARVRLGKYPVKFVRGMIVIDTPGVGLVEGIT